jgi:hypothetical protein
MLPGFLRGIVMLASFQFRQKRKRNMQVAMIDLFAAWHPSYTIGAAKMGANPTSVISIHAGFLRHLSVGHV